MGEHDLQKQVDRVGKMMVALQAHQCQTWGQMDAEWTDAEWAEKRRVILKFMAQMDAELAARGETLATYGWCISPRGDWHMQTETAPPLVSGRSLIIDNAWEALPDDEGPAQTSLFDDTESPAPVVVQLSPWD